MGLLTDPSIEQTKFPVILKNYKVIASVLYIGGICWFLGLAENGLNHGTYFSENALLPGLVQGEFMGDLQAHSYYQALEEEAKLYPSGMPHAWIAAKFTQLGLDTHTHNFTLQYPMSSNKVFSGKNVYGILRSVRGSSTESLVVSAPYRPPSSLHQSTSASIALMLALAEFFSEQVYWAKDIIFLVTEHEQLGAQSWLEAYHRSKFSSGVLNSGDLPARAGPIQAAINLEIGNVRVSHIDVKIEGINGQLPNLDIVNLIHRLCHRENVHHTFKNRNDPSSSLNNIDTTIHQLKTLLSMVSTQATGVPNGNHGLYHRFGIAAVTLEGIRESGRPGRFASLLQLGRILEGICRSLNNLLERFHQSFFFYLLPSTHRYISIGVYMPPFALLGGSLLVVALALWHSTSCIAGEPDDKGIVKKLNKDKDYLDCSLMAQAPVIILMHLLGLLVLAVPQKIALIGSTFNWTPEDSVFLGITAMVSAFLFIPFITNRLFQVKKSNFEVLKCIVILELTVVVFSGSVQNFSLALICTVLYGPIAMCTTASRTWLMKIFRTFLLLLTHPLIVLYIVIMGDCFLNFPGLSFGSLLIKSFVGTKRALMHCIVDGFIYGNWVFDVTCLCLLPIWMMLWCITLWPISSTIKLYKLKNH